MSSSIHQRLSPNFDERDPNVPLEYVVLHYTGMKTCAAALERMCDPEAKVSVHYVIGMDGQIFQMVDESRRAWHAGEGFWRGIKDMNSASIGIELVNPGHEFGYHSFPKVQIETLIGFLRPLLQKHRLSPLWAPLAHADFAPERRADPGELFPWADLAAQGIGVWPDPLPEDYSPILVEEAQQLLRQIGYHCPDGGALDERTQKALIAFQRHYRQEFIAGTLDSETAARLRALARMR